MAFRQAGSGDLDELAVLPQVINGLRSAVSHTGAQAANHLEDGVCQRSLVGHTAFHAFGNQFLLALLEITVLGTHGHGREAAHAAIDLEGTALIDFHGSGALLGTGQQAAQHNAASTRCQGLGDIAGILDAAVRDHAHAVFVSFFRTVGNGCDLRNTDTGNHTGRADGTGADTNLHAVHTGGDQVMRRGGCCHVTGEQGNIRILVTDLFHLLQHTQAVAVGCINIDHVHLGSQQGVNPLKHVVCHAHSGAAQQTAVLVLGAVGVFACLFNILDRDQSAQHAVLVHDRQLLDPVGGQDLFGFFQRGAFGSGDQVFTGHYFADRPAVICFKPKVAVGQDADQLAFPGNRNAADAIAAHQFFRVGDQVFGTQIKGICDYAMLTALDFINLGRLFLDCHVLMDDSQTAFTRHRDGHAAVRHRIHGGTQHGNIQFDVLSQLDRKIHIPGEHFALRRHQQYVVKSQSFPDLILQHPLYPPSI